MIHILNALLELIASLIGGIFNGIANMIETLVPSKNNTLYTSSFGNPKSILTRDGQGFYIGDYSCSLKDSHNHMICIGASGSKKSTAICYPILLQNSSVSYIINDPSSELKNGTAGYLQSIGYKVMTIDLNRPKTSVKFNALAKCRDEQDIYKLANILVRNSLDGSNYDYWAQSAEQIIVFYCTYSYKYAHEEQRNLPSVLELIKIFSFDPKTIDRKIIETGDQMLINEYKSIVSIPDKTLQSSLATAKVALRIYESPNIREICSDDTINFDEFFLQKSALFLCSSAADAFIYRAVTATFFEFFFSHILKKKPYQTNLIPTMVLIDESATMKLSSLSQALALLRKYNVSIATFWQDYNQIEHLYSKNEAANIFSNSGLKVFMPSNKPMETCVMLERILGRYSYQSEPNSAIKVRELMTSQEIRELKQILILKDIEKPLLIDPVQYFQVEKLRKRSLIPYKPYNQTGDSESD